MILRILAVAAVLAALWFGYTTFVAPQCPTCTQPETVGEDAGKVGSWIKDGYMAIAIPVGEAVLNATQPLRDAVEKARFEGKAITDKIASDVDTKLSLQVSCGAAGIQDGVFSANCVFAKPVNDTTQGLPSVFFVIDGKFSSPVSDWTQGENGTFNISTPVPAGATGIVFAGDNITFNGINFTGYTMVNGDGLNYGGWLKQ